MPSRSRRLHRGRRRRGRGHLALHVEIRPGDPQALANGPKTLFQTFPDAAPFLIRNLLQVLFRFLQVSVGDIGVSPTLLGRDFVEFWFQGIEATGDFGMLVL